MSQETRCTNPRIGILIKDFVSDELDRLERRDDQDRFNEHIFECQKCKDLVLDHANATVLLPAIEKSARKRGISFGQALDEFVQVAKQMIESDMLNKLGEKFRSFNFEKEYKEKVIEYFFAEYAAGRTPNPDIMCNKEIKFGLFLEKALELGFDYIATGHYARVAMTSPFSPPHEEGKGEVMEYQLLKGLDSQKDQSYFLYTLTQEQLKHTLFPIGEYTKAEVRRMARELGLPNAEKKDSQGICFVGHINLREFLKQRIPERVGEIVTTTGEVIGHHRGAAYYTIGQRHGLGLGGGTPYYVTAKDTATNQVMVAEKNSPNPLFNQRGGGGGVPSVYSKTTTVTNAHWISPNTFSPSFQGRGRGGGGNGCFSKATVRRRPRPIHRVLCRPESLRWRGNQLTTTPEHVIHGRELYVPVVIREI